MSGYISLPRNRIHEKGRNNKIKFFKQLQGVLLHDVLDGIDFSQDNGFQQQLVNNPLREDVKKFLLVTSDFGEEIQGELDLYVANNRSSEANFRRRLDPISKKTL